MHTIDIVTADKLFEHDNSAAGVIELEPGKALGEHTDSPEEILIVMAGDVEFQIGDERQRSDAGNHRDGTADDAAQRAQCGHDTSQGHRALPRSTRRFHLR